MFFKKNYTRFWFGLINQKMFEMEFLNWPLNISCHLKKIVCQLFNLPHTYGHHPKNNY
jgi:hypothetical protein